MDLPFRFRTGCLPVGSAALTPHPRESLSEGTGGHNDNTVRRGTFTDGRLTEAVVVVSIARRSSQAEVFGEFFSDYLRCSVTVRVIDA